jgi:histidine ammonia-lyase
VIQNVERVLAIELHCAAQGLAFRSERPGTGTKHAFEIIRAAVPTLRGDRELSRDIECIVDLIHRGAFDGLTIA